MNMRTSWMAISLMVIGCMLLSACGAPAAAAPASPAAPSTDASKAYVSINFEQVSTWVRNFNPFSASALGSTLTAVYEPMMIYNKSTGELVPWLATAYKWSDDNLTLTFTIRKDVKWSDGKPFTARDYSLAVIFTQL